MSLGHIQGMAPGMIIVPTVRVAQVGVGIHLLGCILNGSGH